MRTCRLGYARGLSSLVVLLLLAACGGGGGGDSGPAPLVYSGNTSQAVVTTTNASKLTANVIGDGDTTNTILGVSIERGDASQDRGNGVVDLVQRLNRNFHNIVVHVEQVNSTRRALTALIPVDETVLCDGGNGSVRTSGMLNNDGTGTLQVSFNSCLIDGVTLSGPATLRVDVFDLVNLIPTDFTVSFVRLTLRAPSLSVDAGGSLRAQLNIGTNTETITANLVSVDNNTGNMISTENLVFVNVYDSVFFPTSFTTNVSGRVFDQDHGHVDITTPTLLVFGTLSQFFPDSGQMLLMGTGNRSIRVTALSATLARLELDLDGNSVVDNTATLKWTDLSGPVGADLGDTDVDGMHNSWESANPPMNPNQNDAALDNDGDTFTNLSEYLAGTNPNDASSHP